MESRQHSGGDSVRIDPLRTSVSPWTRSQLAVNAAHPLTSAQGRVLISMVNSDTAPIPLSRPTIRNAYSEQDCKIIAAIEDAVLNRPIASQHLRVEGTDASSSAASASFSPSSIMPIESGSSMRLLERGVPFGLSQEANQLLQSRLPQLKTAQLKRLATTTCVPPTNTRPLRQPIHQTSPSNLRQVYGVFGATPRYKLARKLREARQQGELDPLSQANKSSADHLNLGAGDVKGELSIEGAKHHQRKLLKQQMLRQQRQLQTACDEDAHGALPGVVQAKPVFAYPIPMPETHPSHNIFRTTTSRLEQPPPTCPIWGTPSGPGMRLEKVSELLDGRVSDSTSTTPTPQPTLAPQSTSTLSTSSLQQQQSSSHPSQQSNQNSILTRHMFVHAPWMHLPSVPTPAPENTVSSSSTSNASGALVKSKHLEPDTKPTVSSSQHQSFRFQGDQWYRYTDPTRLSTIEWMLLLRTNQRLGGSGELPENALGAFVVREGTLTTALNGNAWGGDRLSVGGDGGKHDTDSGAGGWRPSEYCGTPSGGSTTQGSSKIGLSVGNQTKTGRDMGVVQKGWTRIHTKALGPTPDMTQATMTTALVGDVASGSTKMNPDSHVSMANRTLFCFATEPWSSSYDIEEAGYQQRYSSYNNHDDKPLVLGLISGSDVVQGTQDVRGLDLQTNQLSIPNDGDEDDEACLVDFANAQQHHMTKSLTSQRTQRQASPTHKIMSPSKGGALSTALSSHAQLPGRHGSVSSHAMSKSVRKPSLQNTRMLVESAWPRMAVVPSASEGGLASAALVRHGLHSLAEKARTAETITTLPVTGHTYWLRDDWDQSLQDQAAWLASRRI